MSLYRVRFLHILTSPSSHVMLTRDDQMVCPPVERMRVGFTEDTGAYTYHGRIDWVVYSVCTGEFHVRLEPCNCPDDSTFVDVVTRMIRQEGWRVQLVWDDEPDDESDDPSDWEIEVGGRYALATDAQKMCLELQGTPFRVVRPPDRG